MPPKAEITKDKIQNAAFEIVREQGMDGLTARNIAQKLNCSTQPIYSVYSNMEAVKDLVYQRAVMLLRDKTIGYQDDKQSAALNMAIGFLHFAQQERHLFHLLYLSGYKSFDLQKEAFLGEKLGMEKMRLSNRLAAIDVSKQRRIFVKLSIHLVGIGTMLYSGTLKLDIQEAVDMVKEMYEILLAYERSVEP